MWNPGNFISLLRFRVELGDVYLGEHFRTACERTMYCSPTIQNDIISCIGEWLRQKIVCEVQAAKFYGVCADKYMN